MTENGIFILGGLETQLHDILWAVHDGKTVVEARGGEFQGVAGYGGRGMRVSLVQVCACVRGVALTEPERGVEH